MPGNKLYQVSRLFDGIKKYWSWGTMAQTKYQLALSDKYLVEAKILFEYHQYLLGTRALERSNTAFGELPRLIAASKNLEKDTTDQDKVIHAAAIEHKRVLEMLKVALPDTVTWSPEKEKATELSLQDMVQKAIELRVSESMELKSL